MSTFREQAPPPVSAAAIDQDYDYKAAAAAASPPPPAATADPTTSTSTKSPALSPEDVSAFDGDEALLDLEQLEELHQEAEKMKALGNKHMAAQEYTRAYNAYSAALQLSPVGPSSHVFLSNRAAALLSLKRYNAAATDARRAVALAPTFGKAHARLGQALYFLKDYAGAVAAYEDAIRYEPENQVTQTYLEKAKSKMEKQAKRARGEEVSVTSMSQMTISPSIATDVHQSAGVMTGVGYRGNTAVIANAAAASTKKSSARTTATTTTTGTSVMSAADDDPDFEEALRIQHRANKYLANKQYKAAIEEYTAALFLVPDDPVLSPDLHLGRAHALNGSRRHERAKNDTQLAIKLNPSPAAYSTLGKTLFYMKDYRGSVDAFNHCIELLPAGESLGMFDKAYMSKAQAALEEEEASLRKAGMVGGAPPREEPVVPKLPPPRFVPREQAIQATPNVPPMPKQWPQQSPSSPTAFKCGPEREIVFLSESLGIKLNRGHDGIVRVLSVAPNTPGSPVARHGKIEPGDVVREAAGVDIRRPITNIMWGDTVALIKMAPRPIRFTVAKELSKVPPGVIEEQQHQQEQQQSVKDEQQQPMPVSRPSASSGEESVKDLVAAAEQDVRNEETEPASLDSENTEVTNLREEENITVSHIAAGENSSVEVVATTGSDVLSSNIVSVDAVASLVESPLPPSERVAVTDSVTSATTPVELASEQEDRRPGIASPEQAELVAASSQETEEESGRHGDVDAEADVERDDAIAPTTEVAVTVEAGVSTVKDESEVTGERAPSLRDKEEDMIGGEVLFERTSPPTYNGWDNLRWLSFSGIRKVRFCQVGWRLTENEKKQLFWSTTGKSYEKRLLAIYEEPKLILVLRKPTSSDEVHDILGLPDIAKIEDQNAVDCYWIVESVAEPALSKLRLSSLTTATSLAPEGADERRRSCFELITPTESIIISTVRIRDDVQRRERSFSDSGAFLETLATETALTKALYSSHDQAQDIGALGTDISWRHQIVVGTLHSLVVSANTKALDEAIQSARAKANADAGRDLKYLPSEMIDSLDENGLTPLYYACSRGMSVAVTSLVNAGADVTFQVDTDERTLLHACARNLDDKSLSTMLAATHPSRPDPNTVDAFGRTPMYLAATEGRTVGGEADAAALRKCIMVLEAWGGQMTIFDPQKPIRHPVSILSAHWQAEELSVVLEHTSFRYPLHNVDSFDREAVDMSLSALFHYPIHAALASLHRQISSIETSEDGLPEDTLNQTLCTLLEHGFEPNERLECRSNGAAALECPEFSGYTPLQVLASAAVALENKKGEMSDVSFAGTRMVIEDAAELLVRSGARISVDAPPRRRLRRSTSGLKAAGSSETTPLERKNSSFGLDSNKDILQALGGNDRLKRAHELWSELRPVNATSSVDLWKDEKASFSESEAPGGSSEKSCAICWKAFGTLRNRKHRCRVTRRFVCDECSTKRLSDDGVEYRVSDGQYNLGRVDAAKEEQAQTEARIEREHIEALRAERARAQIRQERIEADEQANRDSLFGGMLDKAANYVFGEDAEGDERPDQKAESITASLNETRNALNERGQKLSSLGEKSSDLVNASADFAKMAKELRKKSEGGLFW